MPEVNLTAQSPKDKPITAWINGAAGSGKTRLALGFPDVFAVTYDPTGLDVLDDPDNAALRQNLRWHVPLNGLPLAQVFVYTETAGESGIYAAIALARELAVKGKIKTFLLDGFTFLAQLKWTQICEAKGIDPTGKEALNRKDVDQRQMYDALGSYLDHLILQNVFPLATQSKLNVVITCHIQRESKNTVEGVQGANIELERQSKRQVNLDSDLSAQVVGGFRQRIDGMPSATIYLEHRLEEDKEGREVIKYYAYCRMTRSQSLDTVVKAKNRYGLGTLNLTGASFYKTLMKKITEGTNGIQAQSQTAQPETVKTKTAKGE